MKLTWYGIFLSFGALALADDGPTVRDRVYQFLDKKVIGRSQKVSLDGNVGAEGNAYQVHFEALISWSGLEKTEEGVVFVETRDIKQTNTKLGADGKPTAEVTKTDRVVVHRHALAEKATSKSLVGLTTVIKSTLEDPTGQGFVSMIDLSDDNRELYFYQSMAGFVEASLDGKTVIPASSASAATLSLDERGKLQTVETLKFYKVDVNKDFSRSEVYRFNLAASEVNS